MPVKTDGLETPLQKDRNATVAFAEKRMRSRKEVLQKSVPAEIDELKQICCALIRIAQQYVPTTPNAFAAFSEVVHCTKMLQKLGVDICVAEKFNAVVNTTGNEVIRNSTDYRYLRNTAIAGFATIADLTEKPAAMGSPEFQHGVREGYRRASNIAMLFLADIQGGDYNA